MLRRLLGRAKRLRASRLAALVLAVAMLAVFSPAPLSTPRAAADSGTNPIVTENQQPGTTAWQPGDKPADDVHKQIKGYASAVSANLGETVTFYVTVNPAQTYSLDIYRIGYYQGLGGRLMQHVGGLAGVSQPACPMDPATGMISCNWSAGYQLTVPTTWTSGAYLAKLINAQGYENYVVFTVRDDSRTSALLYQQSVTTYQSYNNYPDVPRHDPRGQGVLRPALCRRRIGSVPGMGGLLHPLAGGERLRHHLLHRRRYRPERRATAQPQRLPLGGARRVLVEGHVRRRGLGPGQRGEPRILQRQLGLLADTLRGIGQRAA